MKKVIFEIDGVRLREVIYRKIAKLKNKESVCVKQASILHGFLLWRMLQGLHRVPVFLLNEPCIVDGKRLPYALLFQITITFLKLLVQMFIYTPEIKLDGRDAGNIFVKNPAATTREGGVR